MLKHSSKMKDQDQDWGPTIITEILPYFPPCLSQLSLRTTKKPYQCWRRWGRESHQDLRSGGHPPGGSPWQGVRPTQAVTRLYTATTQHHPASTHHPPTSTRPPPCQGKQVSNWQNIPEFWVTFSHLNFSKINLINPSWILEGFI